MRPLPSIFIFFVLLTGCTPNRHVSPPPLGPFKAIHTTILLGSESLINTLIRPTATLGVLATLHLAHILDVSPSHPVLMGIMQQAHLLYERSLPARGAQASLEQLGIAIQINIPDLLNRSSSRADTLNTYIDHMEQTLSEALIQKNLLETLLDETGKNFSSMRKKLGEEQKRQNKAMKDDQFAEASIIQEHLLLLQRELADIESKKNEADNMNDLLSKMIEISQKRLLALRENREILIAGLSVKELPGMDDLEIFKTTKRRGLLR
ncbi:hypothetical protein HYZ98_00270 [Candidatus Peregrinibacteria bacterium]|nr:hypothetical protein [Candidatus Peregrinibacteria bacterium]